MPMDKETAYEFTDGLDEVGAGLGRAATGWWRQIASGMRLEVPEALGVPRDEWAATRRETFGNTLLSLNERRQVVAELTEATENGGEGLSNRQAADVLGVHPSTVDSDRHAVPDDPAPAEPEASPEAEPEDGVPDDPAPAQPGPGPVGGDAEDLEALHLRELAEDARKRKPTITLLTHKGDEIEYPEPKGKSVFNATPGEGISWAQWSWNPVTGCEHGCEYCYARELATSRRMADTYPVGFTPLFHHERLDAPSNTSVPRDKDRARRRVFVCSMADLYGRWVPQDWVDRVHAAELENPQWTYIHLTKFPKRYLEVALPATGWIGASVDEQKRVKHTEEAFRRIDGVAVKWLSLEPLRGPLEFSDLSMFDWVVIGAQTETRQPNGIVPALAPQLEWVMAVIGQARDAGCRVHCKPNLLGRVHPQSPGMELPNEYPDDN